MMVFSNLAHGKWVSTIFLCAVLTLGMTGCEMTNFVASGGNSVPNESTQVPVVGMVNPMQEQPNWRALENTLDDVFEGTMAAPPYAQDVTYYVLDQNIAQINFTLYGVEYTLRGTSGAQDVAGVYGEAQDVGSFVVVSGDETTTVCATSTADMSVFRWSWDTGENYTLICHAQEQDVAHYMDMDLTTLSAAAQAQLAVAYPAQVRENVEVARICAELSSDEGDVDDANDLVEYVGETRIMHSASLSASSSQTVAMMGTTALTREECMIARDERKGLYGMSSTVLDATGESITWGEFLAQNESAIVMQTMYAITRAQSAENNSTGYCNQLMMPAANGSYCTVACVFVA